MRQGRVGVGGECASTNLETGEDVAAAAAATGEDVAAAAAATGDALTSPRRSIMSRCVISPRYDSCPADVLGVAGGGISAGIVLTPVSCGAR